MPDPQPSKRRQPLSSPRAVQASGPHYAEVHCKTNFSFLEAASHPDELVQQAATLGYTALAITDRHSLAGVVRAHVAAKEVGLKLLIGAEIRPVDARPLVLLATDRPAYGRLTRLLTLGRRRASKGNCELTWQDLAEHAQGLLAAVILTEQAERDAEAGGTQTPRSLAEDLSLYRELFGDRCYALAELYRGLDDRRELARLTQLARRARVPLAAANDVYYHVPQRQDLQDVLTSIRLGTTVHDAGAALFPNAERHLHSRQELAERFGAVPTLLERTVEIAARCHFSLEELRYEYPEELCPQGLRPIEYLVQLTWQGAERRYPSGTPAKVHDLIVHELQLIEELRYEAYFLTVWDLVRFARARGILCQGRGSAANSAVCYCLEVTSVDPERMDVLFERFVSRERNEAPDIDVDFEHERREEVLQYLYEKYGRERAGLTAEVITYRPRSAVRDVGKALGLSLHQVDVLAKTLDGYHQEPQLVERVQQAGLEIDQATAARLIHLVQDLVGFPRHLSQHVGGMVITRGPLSELVPIENAAMQDRTVIQWDKDDLDELGILKVDCLALGMLTAIRKCFDLIEQHHAQRWTLANVPAGDPRVYDMISQADTIGVFQIESRAQMSMLPRLRPRCFYDLVIEVAIVRPGPIQGNMVHPYLRRRDGLEPVEFPNEEIREVLQKTLGVPLFQEQAMRLAVVAAGFTPGEADQLRRAMGGWRRPGLIEQFRQKLLAGMQAHGLSEEYAQRVFLQIRGFGEYGFPESHAASFALLVYVSAWLKRYYPAAFAAALLNSQPMGFYAPAQLVRDARQHGVEIRPVDVNASRLDCTLEPVDSAPGHELPGDKAMAEEQHVGLEVEPHLPVALRLGLRLIAGFPTASSRRIEQARQSGAFTSWEDFSRRTQLRRSLIMRLSKANVLRSLGLNRREGLWQALAQHQEEDRPLFTHLVEDEQLPALPQLGRQEEVYADYRTAGLSLQGHPIEFLRSDLDRLRVVRASELPRLRPGSWIRVAGLVLVRQRPSTARGITFVTLEDETGTANLVVRPDIWERWRPAARGAAALLAHGRLERKGQVIHLLVGKLEDLRTISQTMRSPSRDFR